MKTELISLTYSENRAVLLNFLWPILTPHAQVVWLQERYSLLMVMNKHVTLKWSSSESGLKNLWRVLYGVSCTWLPMADSICWMHLLSLGLPRAAFRKLRERQMQSTPFIFIFCKRMTPAREKSTVLMTMFKKQHYKGDYVFFRTWLFCRTVYPEPINEA